MNVLFNDFNRSWKIVFLRFPIRKKRNHCFVCLLRTLKHIGWASFLIHLVKYFEVRWFGKSPHSYGEYSEAHCLASFLIGLVEIMKLVGLVSFLVRSVF